MTVIRARPAFISVMLNTPHALARLSAASLSAVIAMTSPATAAARENQRPPNTMGQRPGPAPGQAYAVLSETWKLVQPCGMDSPEQKHIRKRYEQLCELQNRDNHMSIEGPPRHELYDISKDPGETTDLADQHPDVVRAMTKQYDGCFTDVASRWQQASDATK